MIFMAMMLASVEPSAEALALGRRISERGTLATLLTVGEKKDGTELAARNPGMSETDRAALAETTKRIYAEAREQFLAADAKSLATQLSIEDLRALEKTEEIAHEELKSLEKQNLLSEADKAQLEEIRKAQAEAEQIAQNMKDAAACVGLD